MYISIYLLYFSIIYGMITSKKGDFMVSTFLTSLLTQQQEPKLLLISRRYLLKTHQPIYVTNPRDCHSFHFLISGRISYLWEGGSITAKPGDVIFVTKDSNYDFRTYPEHGEVQIVLVNFNIPNEEPSPVIPPQLLCTNAATRFEPLFLDAVDAFRQQDTAPYLLKARFYLLVHHILELYKTKTDPQAEILERAKRLLNQDDSVTITQIAQQCCISESSLRRLFLQRLGMSPVAYRNSVKIQKACDLLITTDLSVSEIAAIQDYYDNAYFCKCFLRAIGCTPTQYRQKNMVNL